MSQEFKDFRLGQHNFGPSWSTHWFHVAIVIPKELDGQQVVLDWDMGCEGMVWSTDGVPLQGLTGGCKSLYYVTWINASHTVVILVADQARHNFIVTRKATSGEKFKFYIEAACNGMFGVGANDAMVADPNRYFNLDRADLVVANEPIQKLYHDLS